MARQGEAEERFSKLLRALGYAVLRMQRSSEDHDDLEVRLTDVRFKLDADNRTSVLVVLKGLQGRELVVGFVGGPDLESAVLAAGKALAGNAVRWRQDRPYGEWVAQK
jgi:hypothetical protein